MHPIFVSESSFLTAHEHHSEKKNEMDLLSIHIAFM